MIEVILKNIRRFFGFEKLYKDVNRYIFDSNIKSGIFMSAVIVILEVWLIIRQSHDHIAPLIDTTEDKFSLIFANLSSFVLFLCIGLAMFVFCITYTRANKMSRKTRIILNYIAPSFALLCTFFLLKENLTKWDSTPNILKTVLLISIYSTNFVFSNLIILYNVYLHVKKKEPHVIAQFIVVGFALLCLIFGIRTSFSDHIRVIETQNEIICFLTMVIFVACSLIYRPYASILINVGIFVTFLLIIKSSDYAINDPVRSFKDGDTINYITFLFSITTISIMLYHERLTSGLSSRELRLKAEYDELTMLYNNATFQAELIDRVNIYASSGLNQFIILFFNLCNFKVYNEQRGFNRGNVFLQDFAKMLKRAFPEDVIARESGDCFVILTRNKHFKEKIMSLYDEVRDYDIEIKPTFHVGGYVLNNQFEDVRRVVDKARYACDTIENRRDIFYAEYDKKMHDEYHYSQYVINNLDNAIKNGYIKPFYQPIVSSSDHKVCGVEALARWIDPVKGMITPVHFIPTLEKTKLIYRLDAHIIEMVFRDVKFLVDRKMTVVPTNINLSRLDFQLMNVVDLLDTFVDKYQISKDLINIEVTESALTDDEDNLLQDLFKLKERGYHIWLDDFGSGYSSFNVLKDYDFDTIKVDMKFLKSTYNVDKSKIILDSIFKMSDALDMNTLTEGVESDGEKDFLTKAGCQMLQGYLFGKPMPLEEVINKVETREMIFSKIVK
ncbi:MAG: EAL domain-containing protein [Bacilli bacterium]|nr:EAL domain-containing protein [Bacilli bacterium]